MTQVYLSVGMALRRKIAPNTANSNRISFMRVGDCGLGLTTDDACQTRHRANDDCEPDACGRTSGH
jgi:hypothetical protein